jgi:dihydrofolate synthase / folylpolyglutamate synthase
MTSRKPDNVHDELLALQSKGMQFGLERVREGLASLGHPDQALKIIHIVGTNGKGSTAAMIASVLQAAGFKTGLFTSPYLCSVYETWRIDGIPMSPERLEKLYPQVCERVRKDGTDGRESAGLTFFEMSFLLGLVEFRERNVDIAIIEAGLGGEFDATNAIDRPEMTVLTPIDLDHTSILGDTLEQVAAQKAAVLRTKAPRVIALQQQAAMRVIEKHHADRPGPMYRVTEQDVADIATRYPLGLQGDHQHANGALALATIRMLTQTTGFDIPTPAIETGLKRTRWPGRLQWLQGTPPIILDCAHNPSSMLTLAHWLTTKKVRPIALLGVMADKDIKEMFGIIKPQLEGVIFCRPDTDRAAPVETLQMLWERSPGEVPILAKANLSMREGLERILHLAKNQLERPVLVGGSIFTVGEAMCILPELGIEVDLCLGWPF